MMNTWVLQEGFPIIFVYLDSIDDDENVTFYLEQQRMMKGGPMFWNESRSNLLTENNFYDKNTIESFKHQLWQVPISIEYGLDSSVEDIDLMITRNQTITISRKLNLSDSDHDDINIGENYNFAMGINGSDFTPIAGECYMFNHNMNSFYRVGYDSMLYEMILDCFEQLTELSQYAILDDAAAFVLTNYVPPAQYFDLLLTLADFKTISDADDPSYLVWNSVISTLIDIDSILCELYANGDEFDELLYPNGTDPEKSYNEIISKFRQFSRNLLNPIWDNVNKWSYSDTDSEDTIYLRSKLAIALVRFEDSSTIKHGYSILQDIFVKQNDDSYTDYSNVLDKNGEFKDINSNLMQATFEAGLAMLDSTILRHLLTVYDESNIEQQKYILSSLGAVYQDDTLLQEAIDFVLSSTVRDSDKMSGLNSARRCYGRNLVWTNLAKNNSAQWDELAQVYQTGFLMADLTELPETFASRKYFEEIKRFYFDDDDSNLHKTAANERSVNQTIESIAMRYDWLKMNKDGIEIYLAEHVKSSNKKNNGLSDKVVQVIIVLSVVVGVCIIVAIWHRARSKDSDYKKISG